MTDCFREFYRVLKPGRWITIEFSNSDNNVWLGIQLALARVGFVVADTRVFDKSQHSYRQVTAANAVKQDLIISAYRPRAEVAERVRLAAGSEDGVWAFVREHLARLPVTDADEGVALDIRERQVGRLFNRLIDWHLANGLALPMGLPEFTEEIDRKFNRVDAMYFLPSQEEEYQRFRLRTRRPSQEAAFITNESTAVAWLKRFLEGGARAYTDIQPSFFKEVQSGLASYEKLPELRDLLAENFVQNESGQWFVPDARNAEQMERVHKQALLRVFGSYVDGKGTLDGVRSEAIRVGFADAWASRDFERIVAVGRRLPQDFMIGESALHHMYRAAERFVSRA